VAVPANQLDAAYASGVAAIRFPGGAWGDRNDLKSYHIDPFIAFCQQIGAIPTISIRLREGTPEAAAELVRYVNIEKEYGVVYWSIGNEPTLFAAELQALGKADDYDTVQYNQEWREFALAMKAVDPTIKLLGPEIHQFMANPEANPKDSAGRDWMIEFLQANGDLVDVVTFHRYPFPRSRTDVGVTIADLRQQSQEWEGIIIYLRGLIQEITGRDIPIAITEVNTHWNAAVGGDATTDSYYNAIWLAEMIGRLMRQDVFMVNHFMLAAQAGEGAWGMIARSGVRPSYYVYQLYSRFGSEMVYAESGVDDVSIYAAQRDDGALTLIIINLADSEQTATLQLGGASPTEAELWQLTPDSQPESGRNVTLAADGELTLPAQSISLYILQQP
jgi:alpha-L-arabinofuranosidase